MKNNKKIYLLAILLVGTAFISACSRQKTNPGEDNVDEKINVMVSILPQVEFVERIGGVKVQVSAMIPPGFSPATYEPSPKQLQKLQKAEIYFRIGHIAFEKTQMSKLEQINNNMKVVDTSAGIELLSLAAHSHSADEDGYAGDDHADFESAYEKELGEGDDPHIWLSPKLLKLQAKTILDVLVDARVENKAYFQANYDQFIRDLESLDSKLRTAFEPIRKKSILVFHPAFGYLANEYGFEQEAIEIEGKDPSPEHLKKLIDKALAAELKVIFVQKQFSAKSAEAIAEEINGAVIQIDPLAKDYFNNLEEMSKIIVNKIN